MEAASSTEWMLPSSQKAGFSRSGPVAELVIVTSQRSRPSWLFPTDSSRASFGCASDSSRSACVSAS